VIFSETAWAAAAAVLISFFYLLVRRTFLSFATRECQRVKNLCNGDERLLSGAFI
jgi:hypothetical protein